MLVKFSGWDGHMHKWNCKPRPQHMWSRNQTLRSWNVIAQRVNTWMCSIELYNFIWLPTISMAEERLLMCSFKNDRHYNEPLYNSELWSMSLLFVLFQPLVLVKQDWPLVKHRFGNINYRSEFSSRLKLSWKWYIYGRGHTNDDILFTIVLL